MAKKKAGRPAKNKTADVVKVPQKKELARAQVEELAAAENVVIPKGVPDEKAAGYLAQELDARLDKARKSGVRDLDHPSQVVEESPVVLREDEVRAALARHLEFGMEFSVDSEGVWSMKRGIKEDCGNLAMPLRRIVACADMVCQRTLVARVEKDGKDKILMVG